MEEIDLSQERKWFYEQRAKITVDNLQKKNINAEYVSNRQEALATIMEMIPAGAVVGRGDSMSVDQVGIVTALEKRKQNVIIDPMERDTNGLYLVPEIEQRRKIAREIFSTDIFLVGIVHFYLIQGHSLDQTLFSKIFLLYLSISFVHLRIQNSIIHHPNFQEVFG